jgi:hypothetical protein
VTRNKGDDKVDVNELLKSRLRELGAKGGKARAAKLTVKQRMVAAQKAAAARWAKQKGKGT